MVSQIVANSFILKKFSKIDIFKRELGDNLTGAIDPNSKGMKIKIKDDFIKRYNSNTNNIIHKYGKIGKLNFYQDQNLKNNEFVAFTKDNIFEIDIDNIEELNNNPSEYLGKVLENLDNVNNEESKQNYITNTPEDNNDPDINMMKDNYIEAMVERRQKLSPINKDDEKIKEIIEKRKKKHYG